MSGPGQAPKEGTAKYVPVFPFFVAAAALCAALLPLPYGYYTLLRIGLIGFAWYGFHVFTQIRLWGLRWIPFVVAVPWASMRMRREEWAPLDLAAAALFAGFGILARTVERAKKQKQKQ